MNSFKFPRRAHMDQTIAVMKSNGIVPNYVELRSDGTVIFRQTDDKAESLDLDCELQKWEALNGQAAG
jgi:hypothetical protein